MTTTRQILIVNGRDNWTERMLDKIEAAANGKIKRVWDDSCGNTKLFIYPRRMLIKAERNAVLDAVRELAPKSHWGTEAEIP